MRKEMREFKDNLKNFLAKNDNNTEILLFESNLSSMWRHIQAPDSFGVISPFRKDYSEEENLERYTDLNKIRNELKLGCIELEGGFNESGVWVREKSLFITGIKKNDNINWGNYLNNIQ